ARHQTPGTLFPYTTFFRSSATFNFNGGAITGTPLLHYAALDLGAAATAPAVFTMHGASTLSGNIPAGVTVLVQGSSAGGHATLTVASGYINAGTTRLQRIA